MLSEIEKTPSADKLNALHNTGASLRKGINSMASTRRNAKLFYLSHNLCLTALRATEIQTNTHPPTQAHMHACTHTYTHTHDTLVSISEKIE